MDTKFLVEDYFLDAELLVETADDGKSLYLVGTMMQAGVKNRNGREYTKEDITNAVGIINEKIKNRESVMGELDHPQSLTINLDRVSHIITEAKMVGNDAVGKLKILDTPMGNIVRKLVEAGVRLGLSSRGTGAVGPGGMVKNFIFSAMDVVATPSAQGAYPDSVMEAVDVLNGTSTTTPEITLTESVRDDEDAQKQLANALLAFIQGLSK